MWSTQMRCTPSLRRPITSTAASARLAPCWRGIAASRRACITVTAAFKNSRTEKLRTLLNGDDILLGPCCHDALSAKLIEQAGFPYAFMSGFCTSAARLGAPDTGLISYGEMVDTGRYIYEATRSLPVIGDGDTGYGNAMNVKRTVRGYAQAGFAGILIEDQVAPKSCGHVRGKRVVGREEAVSRIRAAVDARDEGADILIVARTDARQAVSLEEALWRAQAFAEAGADVLFIDALESEEEMRAFTELGGAAAAVPKMANMLEGGGKTPIFRPSELQTMGFKLVAYPLSLLGVSIRAMQDALIGLRRGRVPPVETLGTFADIQAAVGFPEYFEEEQRYAISTPTSVPAGAPEEAASEAPAAEEAAPEAPAAEEAASEAPAAEEAASEAPAAEEAAPEAPAAEEAAPEAPAAAEAAPEEAVPNAEAPVVEPEVVVEDPTSTPSDDSATWPLPPESTASTTSALYPSSSGSSHNSSGSGSGSGADAADDPYYRRNRSLRVRISDVSTGLVKLETRIPAGFLNGLTALVPQVSGFNIEALLEQAMGPGAVRPQPGQPLISIPTGNDVVQIFLE
ncbi:hypothetical protein Vretimale_3094 [Volvox reticuliferus]|uniref:Isocitrate lyase n=1 Tax=Volvox reticuliferus TaxID=1737510 RepID=A0A8J4CEN4_9CHLO|nr:hypothetical protein Vretifemale_6716 [Volvox reticuliferus]GIL97452.1 hypothetical protein Vretimale_3094 [Volvox reticuliferus]